MTSPPDRPRIPLLEEDAAPDPITQFRWWYEAAAAEPAGADAMVLATSTPDGQPSARTVLLKGFSERGFAFFTNYDSRKGRELAANPNVALVFLWRVIARQVIVTGIAEKASAEESDTYFASRPRGSQLGAWASRQSQVIDSRAVLEQDFAALDVRYHDTQIPRPPGWGGFVVEPATVEFWQGRDDRLHDRLRYRRNDTDGVWMIERLAP